MKTTQTKAYLESLLLYDPEAGHFAWRQQRGNRIKVGSRAGAINTEGYVIIRVDRIEHRAHRLAFLFMTGETPAIIDHINGNRADNRFSNLRAATPLINSINCKMRKTNTSGHKGVSFFKASGRWQASIRVNRKRLHLGLFETPELAGEAYRAAAKQHFGTYARSE